MSKSVCFWNGAFRILNVDIETSDIGHFFPVCGLNSQ